MSTSAGSDSFVDKWLGAEPWHRLLLVFEPSATRGTRQLLESIGFELRSAALDSSDVRVAGGKLAWWAEEWRMLAAGTPRHPLTVALRDLAAAPVDPAAGAAWASAALSLAREDSDAGIDAWIARWQPFAAAQARAFAPWLRAGDGDSGGDAAHADRGSDSRDPASRMHALALACERLPRLRTDIERGRLPVPLSTLAAQRLDRAGFRSDEPRANAAIEDLCRELAPHLAEAMNERTGTGYRRGQLALARLRIRSLQQRPAEAWQGRTRLPPMRAAFAAWRARVGAGTRGG
jgi:phytoene synthase